MGNMSFLLADEFSGVRRRSAVYRGQVPRRAAVEMFDS